MFAESVSYVVGEDGNGQLSVITRSDAQTQTLAQIVAPILPRGALIGLSGQLGAGKTEFVRGVAQCFEVALQVSSPTYVLENIYQAKTLTLSHWDLYRLNQSGIDGLDLLDYLGRPDTLVLVEWPSKVAEIKDLLEVEIVIDFLRFEGEEARSIAFCSNNSALLSEIQALLKQN